MKSEWKVFVAIILLMTLAVLGVVDALFESDTQLLALATNGVLLSLFISLGLWRRSNLARNCAAWLLALYLLPAAADAFVISWAISSVGLKYPGMIVEMAIRISICVVMLIVIWSLTSEGMKRHFNASVAG